MIRALIISILLPNVVLGQQNLVQNGSFEQYSYCPLTIGQWMSVLNWGNGNQLTPDYYNRCSPSSGAGTPQNIYGWQQPYEGDAYMGVYGFGLDYPEGREYIQSKLDEDLIAHVRYVIKFYTSPADGTQYAISTLGAAVTIEPPPIKLLGVQNGMLDAQPQVLNNHIPLMDTAKWVLISDTVLANGGEKYITIGNFHLDSESDTIRFNPNQPPTTTGWPSTFAYYYIDDVSVIALDSVPNGIEGTENLSFSVYPNPATETLNIQSAREIVGVRVLDMRGRSVLVENIAGDRHTLSLSAIPNGVYMLEVTDTEGHRGIKRFSKIGGP